MPGLETVRSIAYCSIATEQTKKKWIGFSETYPTQLQLNKAYSSDTEAPFFDLNRCMSDGTVSIKIYDKRDEFGSDIVNFPWMAMSPGVPHMGYTYLDWLDSSELLQILVTLTAVIEPLCQTS